MKTDRMGDQWLSSRPEYLTDLDACTPSEHLSTDPLQGYWRKLAYEAEDLTGVMLAASTETAAPDVTYSLNHAGLHAVSLGVFGGYQEPGEVRLRLSGEKSACKLTLPRHTTTPWYRQYHGEHLWELYWKIADLTSQVIVLGQVTWRIRDGDGPESFKSNECMIAYVKLVPLTDQEAEQHRADLARTDSRRLFTHSDTGPPVSSAEEIQQRLEILRDGDFARLYWRPAAATGPTTSARSLSPILTKGRNRSPAITRR